MPSPARIILICDVRQLDALFARLNLEALRVVGILGSVLRPAIFRHPSGDYPVWPACDVDRLAANAADFCIILRGEHGDDLLGRLADRGFGRERVVDLDFESLFHLGPGLLSAAQAVRAARLRWDGFITGLSYFRDGVMEAEFGHRLANFGGGGQDLYYDYALAREVLVPSPQRFRYAVIGLAPYSFDYDLAKSANVWRTTKYLATLRDAHGAMDALPVTVEQLFNPRFFLTGSPGAEDLTLEAFPSLHFARRAQIITLSAALAGRRVAQTWSRRNYVESQAANSRLLGQYVDLCRAAGIAVFLATPPLPRLFRAAYGAERMAEFNARLRPQLEKPGVWYRDFYSETDYEPTHFYDGDHVNTKGAQRFSVGLRAWIEQTLAGG